MLTLKKYLLLLYILSIPLLSYLSLHKALAFQLWRDDWADYVITQNISIDQWTHWNAFDLHPGSALEKFIGYHILGTNSYYWQLLGLFLKILNSFTIGLMMLGLTGSRRVAAISSLLFATFAGGIESYVWLSAHTSAWFILFFSIGVYFWVTSLSGGLIKFIVALILLGVSISITPVRGTLVLFILAAWDILTYIQFPKGNLSKYSLRISSLVGLYILIFLAFEKIGSSIFSSSIILGRVVALIAHADKFLTYISNLGTLIVGWVVPIDENSSLSNATFLTNISGLAFLLIALWSSFNFFRRKTIDLKIIVFLLLWIFLFYLPNWLFDINLPLGLSHRYLTTSAVGVVCIFAFLFARMRRPYFVLIFLLLNIFISNGILNAQLSYRSVDVVNSIWDKIDEDVPKGERDSIFVYSGTDYLRGAILDWSASIPFGIKRKITNKDDFPIVVYLENRELIIKLLCVGKGVKRPSVDTWIIQERQIPLSHLHVWDLSNGTMTNVSLQTRDSIAKEVNCKMI